MPPATPTAGCELRRWTVFAPGYWKGTLYTPADLRQLAANFARLLPHLRPTVKLGHSDDQALAERLKQSLGFLSLGDVAAGGLNPDDSFWLTITGIPVEVGGQVNARRINSGSVELDRDLPDPGDPARRIPGPVLTAISLLGEEQPALKDARLRMPRAVFADGTEVPPAASAAPWLDAMAHVARTFSAHAGNRRPHDDRRRGRLTLCFSDYRPEAPVDPQALIAALQGLTPEQLQQVLAGVQPPAPAPNPADPAAQFSAGLKKYSDDPATPDYAKALMSAFSQFAGACTQRMGAMEAGVSDLQKMKPDLQASAKFSQEYRDRLAADRKDRVTRDVDRAVAEGRLEPRDRADKVAAGLARSDAQKFADGPDKGKTEYEAWRDELLSRRPSQMFTDLVDVNDPPPADGSATDPYVQRALQHMPGFREPAYRPLSQTAAK